MTEELNKKTFSIAEAAAGTAYPKSTFSYYSNYELLQEFLDLDVQINTAKNFNSEVAALEEEQHDLAKELMQSKITIFLTGIPRRVRRSAFLAANNQGKTESDRQELAIRKVITASILRIENAAGEVDETDWSIEDASWLDAMSENDYSALFKAVDALSISSARFDNMVDIDFLSKS